MKKYMLRSDYEYLVSNLINAIIRILKVRIVKTNQFLFNSGSSAELETSCGSAVFCIPEEVFQLIIRPSPRNPGKGQ